MSEQAKTTTVVSQLGDRSKYIGASDVPAILGFSPWRTKWDVWAEKTSRLIPDNSSSKIMEAGTILEPSIIDWAANQIGEIERTVEIPRNDFDFPLIVHLDGRRISDGDPVEAKTSGLFSPLSPDWGDDGTDEVPKHIAIQAQTQLIATDRDLCHIPAFLGGRGFVLYRILAHAGLQAIILSHLTKFWVEQVLKNEPPLDSLPTLGIAKRIKRQATTVDISGDLIEAYLAAHENERATKKTKKEVQAAIISALGDAEAGNAEGVGQATYFEQKRSEYTVEASTFRVLRIKKEKL